MTTMDDNTKKKIRNLLFQRVGSARQRAKIYQLAYILGDGDTSDEYWSCLYHYALSENWPDLERDYRKYAAGKLMLTEKEEPQPDQKDESNGKRKDQ